MDRMRRSAGSRLLQSSASGALPLIGHLDRWVTVKILGRRQLIAVSIALIVGLGASVAALATRKSTSANTPYALRFLGITRGTNHTVYVGNPILARINAFLMRQLHIRPLGRSAYAISAHTSLPGTAIWVSWRRPANVDGRPFGLRLRPRGGEAIDLELIQGGEWPQTRLNEDCFIVPSWPTGFSSSEAILQTGNGEQIAVVRFR